MKTFIVIKLKEGVYDTKEYRQRIAEMNHANASIEAPLVSLYGPLKRLADFLFASILFSLIAATSQLTLGIISRWESALFCVVVSTIALVNLFFVLIESRSNLQLWFDLLEESTSTAQTAEQPKEKQAEETPKAD